MKNEQVMNKWTNEEYATKVKNTDDKWTQNETTMNQWWNNDKRTHYELIKIANTKTLNTTKNENNDETMMKPRRTNKPWTSELTMNTNILSNCDKWEQTETPMRQWWNNDDTMENEQIVNK